MSESTASTPDEIREEIEQTRVELSDTVDALTAKLDVKAQVKGRVAEAKSSVTGKAANAVAKAKQAAPAPVQNALDMAGAKLNGTTGANGRLNSAGARIDDARIRVTQAGAKASPLVEQARTKASPLVEQARTKASPLVEQARTKASPLVEQARPYGKQIAAGLGALLAAVLVLRRRSK
jgi:cell division septum initiation protein DivIVA